ncbi:MAG: neprosin family prolyl endopeptidase [Polyangiaceae bacterium]|nr:neprosin family prolyl endopeptidase [Polyangiaceae bacterium]
MIRDARVLVCSIALGLLCTACDQIVDDECVLGEGMDGVAAEAANPPRALEPADRVVSEEVRAYLEARLQQMEIVATTTTKRGSVYDWIDINSQVSDGPIASPPPLDPQPDTTVPGDGCRPVAARGELEEEPEENLGPPGTVPVLRIDPDQIHAPGSVEDFLSKYGNVTDAPAYVVDESVPLPQVVGAGHFHAGTQRMGTNYGGEGYINLWEPFVLFPTEQSLAQTGVSVGTGIPKETIEAGWHVNGALYGNFSVRFFVYFTTNGYTQPGDLKGGYNAKQSGWVQTSRKMVPGTILTPTSVIGGVQVDFYIRVQLHDGKWWVRYDDEFVGYYPASLFSEGGLRTKAETLLFFGEANDDPKIEGMTVNDMGSGKFPGIATWKQNAAYMRFLQVQDVPEGHDRKTYNSTHEGATNPKCYDLVPNFNATDDWHSQFYFGGQGQNPSCP